MRAMPNARQLKPLKILLLLPAMAMTACSWLGIGGDEGWLRDRQGDYVESPTVEPLEIPQQLDAGTVGSLYTIPPAPEGQGQYFVTPPPPEPIDTRVRDNVVVQQFGDRAWIVLGATPGQVWPRLLDYWSTEGLPLREQDPVNRAMETEWLPQQEGDTNRRHKYRVWVEPGLHAGNSEIYIRHVSDQGGSPPDAPDSWPDESDSRQRENAMLTSISQYLADRTDLYRASSVSLLAGSVEAESKASVVTEGGATRLRLAIDFERAWSQVRQSMENSPIEILEADDQEDRFRVAFAGSDAEEAGFFGRLFGGDSEVPRFTVRVEEQEDAVMVLAAPEDASTPASLQASLIRTINDNLL